MAYELTGYKWGSSSLGTGSGLLTYSFEDTFFDDLRIAARADSSDLPWSSASFLVAAEQAFETWASVADIEYLYDPDVSAADIVIGMETLGGTAIGMATTSFTPNFGSGFDTAFAGLIELDADRAWSPDGESGFNFFNVFLHELGHVLGLDHPSGPGAANEAMYAFYTADETISLGPGDIEGIQLLYGAAIEQIIGSLSADVFDFSGRTEPLLISSLAGDDVVIGTQGDDRIFGGAGNDVLSGGAGNDLIVDTLGSNDMSGGTGLDVLMAGLGASTLSGGAGDDVLLGGTAGDLLLGGAGNDLLVGDPAGFGLGGNDRLHGGTGNDRMTGGIGADMFEFHNFEGADEIGDFAEGSGFLVAARDFTPGLDKIFFASGTFSSVSEVFGALSANFRGDAVIAGNGTTLTLHGVSPSEMSAADFIFEDMMT